MPRHPINGARQWAILTGEYPPQPGGVADYTAQLAAGLAAAGDHVTVYAPSAMNEAPQKPGVVVRHLPDFYGPRAIAVLERELLRWPGRVLLQYTPHAFGCKAMNVPLCGWLWARGGNLDVMFHEVAYPFLPGQPWKHKLLAATHRSMASLLLGAAEHMFMSIPGWEPILRRLAFSDRMRRFASAPIPSNLPTSVDTSEVARQRRRLLRDNDGWLVGHFGTYADGIKKLLKPALQQLLQHEAHVRVVLLGYGGPAFAAELTAAMPTAASRIAAPGPLTATEVAAHLAACDVLLQPYQDGISTRRTSAMAGLALGRPMITTHGHNTEPFWRTSRAIEISVDSQFAEVVHRLLDDSDRRADMCRQARELYQIALRSGPYHPPFTLRLSPGKRLWSYSPLETVS